MIHNPTYGECCPGRLYTRSLLMGFTHEEQLPKIQPKFKGIQLN